MPNGQHWGARRKALSRSEGLLETVSQEITMKSVGAGKHSKSCRERVPGCVNHYTLSRMSSSCSQVTSLFYLLLIMHCVPINATSSRVMLSSSLHWFSLLLLMYLLMCMLMLMCWRPSILQRVNSLVAADRREQCELDDQEWQHDNGLLHYWWHCRQQLVFATCNASTTHRCNAKYSKCVEKLTINNIYSTKFRHCITLVPLYIIV